MSYYCTECETSLDIDDLEYEFRCPNCNHRVWVDGDFEDDF